MLGMGAGQLIRFGKSLILTRLLLPEVYGTMAIVWSVLFALGMLSDAGLQAAALRHKNGNNPDFMNTIWTMKIVRGILSFIVTLIISYPISNFYNMPDLVWLIPIAGFSYMVEGFSSTRIYSIQRNMVFGRLTLLELAIDVIGLVVVSIWAYFYPGVGALIGAAFVSTATHCVFSHTLLPGQRNKFHWDPESAKEVFHFGKWILLSSAIYLVYSQGDRMMLGKYITSSQLGIYSIAIMLSEVVTGVMGKVNTNVIYPALNNVIANDRNRLKTVFYKTRLLTDCLMLIPIAILLLNAEHIINIMYDARYRDAGWILQILCLRLLMLAILTSSDSCMLALGKPKFSLIQNAVRAAVILIGIPFGWAYAGIHGVVWAVALTEVPVLFVLWYGMISSNVFSIAHELRSILLALFGATLGYLISHIIFM